MVNSFVRFFRTQDGRILEAFYELHSANFSRECSLHIDPTMLMKTKDDLLYPTISMKTQVVTLPCHDAETGT